MRFALDLLSRMLGVSSSAADRFDAQFYLSHYEDLSGLRTHKRALRHYQSHGKTEGRFPNEDAYLAYVSALRQSFDLAAYKHFNRDLTNRFGSEAEFFRHYVRHGHREGRQCKFPDDGESEATLPASEKWKAIFSAGDLVAWCGTDLDIPPATREAALALFEKEGVERLWPINLAYIFDPSFVRGNGLLSDHALVNDVDLYRAWLADGFPRGIAPNEGLFLAPYLGGMPFPATLDWKAAGSRLGMSTTASRSQILVALFDAPAKTILGLLDLFGSDAARLLERMAQRALAAGDFDRAQTLLSRCLDIAPTAHRHALMGSAHQGRRNYAEALESCRTAMAMGEAPLQAFLDAAAILSSNADFSAAYGVLREAKPAWRHKAALAQTFLKLVQAHFDHVSAAAHALYRKQDSQARAEADLLLTSALDEIRSRYLQMDNLPAPTGGDPRGPVVILANDDLPQCTYYRIQQKVRGLGVAGIPVQVFSHHDVDDFFASLIGARAAIFYRVGAVPAVLRAIVHSNAMAVPTWYEIDDLLFDAECYPDPFVSFEGQVTAEQYAGLQFSVPLIRYALSLCQGAIASTPVLAERMQALIGSGDTLVLRNGVDDRNAFAISLGAAPVRGAGRIRIFYGSGTKAHNADFNRLAAPALAALMARYPHVELVIVGHLKLDAQLEAFPDRITIYPFISDLDTYWSVLATCDINLAVLEPGPVADCKSEIKWLEAAVLQVPSVVSDTRTYREALADGDDALIASSPSLWFTQLERLVADPDVRALLGSRARAKALREYSLGAGAAVLHSAFSLPARASVGRLRVLVCNVYYAPQSYGGATRIVEDNVRAFAQRWPDLDVAVFCSDEGTGAPGRLRMEEVDGIPVYRLATGPDPCKDRTAFNGDHAEPFARVLDHFKPDVIHYHCMQYLSATVVDLAHERRIPYMVTLHDGWWISDDQFLVDRDGLLHLPGRDALDDCSAARKPLSAIVRRQRLRMLLQGAAARVSVSAPFAQIYADAGIEDIRVIPNDVRPIAPALRKPRTDGKVALGHIGGRTAHKGAVLVEAVLRTRSFTNLHLTMVDGSIAPGEEVETVWGTTPVTLVAPVASSRVAELYARLDVLLAPSTWPESFGLVTREAAMAGLWCVASNLGAIGEGIEDGRSGHLIDPFSPHGLAQVLAQIDAAPATYRAGAPRACHSTNEHEQADRLRALYHEIS